MITENIIRLSYADFDKLEQIKQNIYKDNKNRILEVLEVLEDFKIVKLKEVLK
ncbi:MAG TPA: hypothetical protein VGB37_01100 [Candidatus Lokiarchaeia archaeon]